MRGLSLILAGCGKMGGALLDGWLERGLSPKAVRVVEPGADAAATARHRGVAVFPSADALPSDATTADVVLLAVKPQVMDQVVPAYRRFVSPATVFLSIAAGRTIAGFESLLGADAALVRCMPNTPAAVRRGMTVACANARVTAEQRTLCQELLEAVGDVAWIENESLMDAVTAVSGSGPAYVFLLAEALAQAGAAAGLSQDLAARLARRTVSGAGELLHQSPESPETLRRNVTSPGGTTAAALSVLMENDSMMSLMTKAVTAAKKRSQDLAH